jgi:hypothetical protein
MHQFGQPPLKTVYADPFPFRGISSELNIKTVAPNPRSGNARTLRSYVTGKLLPGEDFPLVCDLMVQFRELFVKLGFDIIAEGHVVWWCEFLTWVLQILLPLRVMQDIGVIDEIENRGYSKSWLLPLGYSCNCFYNITS